MTAPKRPRDTNQLAKMVVDLAVGDIHELPLPLENGNEATRRGGLAGGEA